MSRPVCRRDSAHCAAWRTFRTGKLPRKPAPRYQQAARDARSTRRDAGSVLYGCERPRAAGRCGCVRADPRSTRGSQWGPPRDAGPTSQPTRCDWPRAARAARLNTGTSSRELRRNGAGRQALRSALDSTRRGMPTPRAGKCRTRPDRAFTRTSRRFPRGGHHSEQSEYTRPVLPTRPRQRRAGTGERTAPRRHLAPPEPDSRLSAQPHLQADRDDRRGLGPAHRVRAQSPCLQLCLPPARLLTV